MAAADLQFLGLAHSVRLRPADRPGRLLHPQQYGGDAGILRGRRHARAVARTVRQAMGPAAADDRRGSRFRPARNTCIVFMPTYAIRELHLPQSIGFTAAVAGGRAADRGGAVCRYLGRSRSARARIMIGAALLFFLTAYPVFCCCSVPNASLAVLMAMVCWIGLLKSFYSGALPSLMARDLSRRDAGHRHVAELQYFRPIFGGFAPFFAASLIDADRQQAGAELLHHGDRAFAPRLADGATKALSALAAPGQAAGRRPVQSRLNSASPSSAVRACRWRACPATPRHIACLELIRKVDARIFCPVSSNLTPRSRS